MNVDEKTYAEIGRSFVGLVEAARKLGHKRVKSAANHDVIPPEDDKAMQFVVDAFTKSVDEISAKYFDD